jgi:hypothetical protein
MEKNEWYRMGVDKGWITEYCYTHTFPMTDAEIDYETEHGEVCIPVLRYVRDE